MNRSEFKNKKLISFTDGVVVFESSPMHTLCTKNSYKICNLNVSFKAAGDVLYLR